jgi:sugar phosphate isomerase/epimerase
MINRRKFLRTITAGTAMVITANPFLSCTGNNGKRLDNIGYISGIIGRELKEGDWKEVLARTVEMGYSEIETGNYMGESAASFLEYLRTIGLKPVAGGGSFSKDEEEVKRAFDRLNSIEVEYAVLYWPWFGGAPLSLENCKESAHLLNRIGEISNEHGLTLCWHNHDLEFFPTGEGTVPFDYLMENTDPDLVKCELDIYWAKKGGADPVETLKRYKGRFPLLHIKDMAPGEEQTFACPGNGIIDFGEVLAEALDQDIKHFFVEKDNVKDGMGCLASAAVYLQSLRF